jgi:hypothetical protein
VIIYGVSLLSEILRKLDKPLAGTFAVPADPELSLENIFTGTFQTQFEAYLSEKLPGRPVMTRLYNSTDNPGLTIGKNGYLFEPWYAISYLAEPDAMEKDAQKNKIQLLVQLQKKMEKIDKAFFVIITPSKASFYPEYLPDDYSNYARMKKNGAYSKNFYEFFIPYADEIGLNYYDGHNLLLAEKERGKDIFAKGGTHWTAPAAVLYFNEMIGILNKRLKEPAGIIEIEKETPVWGTPFMADGDIEDILNLLPAYSLENFPRKLRFLYQKLFPRNQYFSSHLETVPKPTGYRPNIFLVGGSFNWTWLSMIYDINIDGIKGRDSVFGTTEFSYYNSYITKFPEFERIADTTENFTSVLDKDILIIEFNEEAIKPNASQFAFAENLLDFMEKE